MSGMYAGVDIGGTSVKLGLFQKNGELLCKWEIPTRKENQGDKILPDIASSLKEKASEMGGGDSQLQGIGIGVPGPITEDGTVLKCANLGWGIFSVKDKMEQLTGVSNIKVGNDANVAALGEMWKGGGKGFQSIVMVTLGTGVGGGVILNGKIVTGAKGAGGEIGHIKVEYEEEDACGCGNHGCLEQYASATGIVRMAKKALQKDTEEVKTSVLSGKNDLSAKDIFDAAKEEDGLALKLLDNFGKYLGTALSNVACVVDPDAFVIGGGVSKAGDIILKHVIKYYNEKSMFALKNKEFKLAELGNDAGIFGSVKMVI